MFLIQILRGITAESENNSFPDEGNNSLSFNDIFDSKFNIFNYEDGRECLGIFVILLWIKLTNRSRAPRYENIEAFCQYKLFMKNDCLIKLNWITTIF